MLIGYEFVPYLSSENPKCKSLFCTFLDVCFAIDGGNQGIPKKQPHTPGNIVSTTLEEGRYLKQ